MLLNINFKTGAVTEVDEPFTAGLDLPESEQGEFPEDTEHFYWVGES